MEASKRVLEGQGFRTQRWAIAQRVGPGMRGESQNFFMWGHRMCSLIFFKIIAHNPTFYKSTFNSIYTRQRVRINKYAIFLETFHKNFTVSSKYYLRNILTNSIFNIRSTASSLASYADFLQPLNLRDLIHIFDSFFCNRCD